MSRQHSSVDSLINFQAPNQFLVARFSAASGFSYHRSPVTSGLIRSELHSLTTLVLTTPRPRHRHAFLHHFLHFSDQPMLHSQDYVTLSLSTQDLPTSHGACCRLELLLDPGLNSRAVDTVKAWLTVPNTARMDDSCSVSRTHPARFHSCQKARFIVNLPTLG